MGGFVGLAAWGGAGGWVCMLWDRVEAGGVGLPLFGLSPFLSPLVVFTLCMGRTFWPNPDVFGRHVDS